MAFSYKQRKDGGFDFFDALGNKTTIENYTRGTGTNMMQLRNQLAQQGDAQSKSIVSSLPKQLSASALPQVKTPSLTIQQPTQPSFVVKPQDMTAPQLTVANQIQTNSKPTNIQPVPQGVNEFNSFDVNAQRKRIADLQGLANRREFNSQEDIKNAQWAQQQLADIEKMGTKKAGNPLTFAQDFAAGVVNPGAQLVNSVSDTLNQNDRNQKLQQLYKSGQIDRNQLYAGYQNVLQNSVDTKAVADDGGNISLQTKNPIEFGTKFIKEGADAGLTYNPYGMGYKTAIQAGGIKAALPLLAKEGAVNTAANVANDALQGREITPESIAMNAAMSFGGSAIGAVASVPIKNVKVHTVLMDNNPVYRANTEKLTNLDTMIQRASVNGDARALEGLQTVKAKLSDQNAIIAKRYSEQGFAKVPSGQQELPLASDVKAPSSADIQTAKTSPEMPISTSRQRLENSTPQESVLSPVGSPKTDSTIALDTTDYIKNQVKLQKEAKGKVNPIMRAKNDFAAKAIDSLSPIEKPIERMVGRENTLALRNQLDRSLRSDTIAGQYLKDNGLDKVIKSVRDTKAFDQYLIAKHAQDLEKNGVKTGRNLVNDQALVRQLAPEYETYAKAVSTYNNKLLDKTVEYGLISKDTASYLKQKYPNYVPFDRIFSENELANGISGGGGVASLSKQTVVQRIKGSNRQINSPLENILAKTHDVVAQGEKNLAAKEIVKSMDLKGNPLGLKEIKPTETIGNRSTISLLDNGKKRVFETTPEVAAAAKSLNKEQINLLVKILRVPTRALRLGATGLNVAFTAANVVKDIGSMTVNSRHPLRAADPRVFVKALAAAFYHRGKSYSELTRNAAAGTSFDIARSAAEDTVKKIRSGKNVLTKVSYTVTHPGELVRAVEDTIGRSEEFGRALQYYSNKEAALKAGKSASEAVTYGADAARNNTVNFARAGEYGRVLNTVLPYLNAGVQGSRTLLRSARDYPAQTAAKVAIIGFMPVAAATAWNLNDPKRKEAYDDIPDYEKEGNIIIIPPNPVKDKDGRWNAIKIPVSQELANMNNIVRSGVESLNGDKNFDFGKMAGELAGTATSINATDARSLTNQITPQAVKPLIETSMNTNLFTGNQIVPDSQRNLAPKDQYGDNTSGTAKVLGKITNSSPYLIDNALRTMFAGAGQNAINLSDKALAASGQIGKDEVKGTPVGTGITKRFYTAAGGSGYNAAEKKIQDATAQLYKNSDFQALSKEDRAKELNRLSTDITKTEVSKYNSKYPQTVKKEAADLTKNQKKMLANGIDVSSYTKSTAQKENSTGASADLPDNFSPSARKVLETYDTMNTDERDKWNAEKNTDSEVTKSLQSWIGGKEKLPEVTNEVAKDWADYQKKYANGKVSKLKATDEKKAILKKAFNSQLSTDEKEISGLSKSELQYYYENGVINDENINKAIAVEKQMYNAGLITKETLQRNLGITARGYKSSSGGASTKTSIASIIAGDKSINQTNNDTYTTLSKLLGSISKKSTPKTKIGKDITLKKIKGV